MIRAEQLRLPFLLSIFTGFGSTFAGAGFGMSLVGGLTERNLLHFGYSGSRECEFSKVPFLKAPPGLELAFDRALDDGKALTSTCEDSMTKTPSAVSEDQDDLLPSIGSFGHPELCAPPCVYFAWGPCAKGAYCGFCHMAHREPIGKLDKRQRKIFQKLEEVEMITLVLPHLKERAKQLELCEEIEVVLGCLTEHLSRGFRGCNNFMLTERKAEKLSYVLRQMPFQGLISLILAREDFDASFLETLTIAAAKLRARAPRTVGGEKSKRDDLHWL